MSDWKELRTTIHMKTSCWHSQEEEAKFWHFSCPKLHPEGRQQPGSRLEGRLHRKRLDSTTEWHRRRMKMLQTSAQGSARRKEQCGILWSSDKVIQTWSATEKKAFFTRKHKNRTHTAEHYQTPSWICRRTAIQQTSRGTSPLVLK